MTVAAERIRTPEARLLDGAAGARIRLGAAVACGFVAAALVIGGAYLLAVVVSRVFLEGGTLATVALPLAALAAVAITRAPLLVAAEALAQDASGRVRGRLRGD